MRLRAKNEHWSANAKLTVCALDSAGINKGVQWDYRLKKMVGQCESHKFSPLSNKFTMMADQLKAARREETENEGEVSYI